MSTTIRAGTRHRWSQPVESLLAGQARPTCDVLVVGSGYGGSVAALELAGAAGSVWVFERGRHYRPGEFPDTLGELPGHVQFTRNGRAPVGRMDALFDLRAGAGGAALVGCGLGGTSLINAGVTVLPDASIWDDARWPPALRQDRAALLDCADRVRRLLGAQPFEQPQRFAKYRALQRLAASVGAHCEPAPIAVCAKATADNGAGVAQAACTGCGNCVTGCNAGAKNTLDATLIPRAVRAGARFYTGAQALRVEPCDERDLLTPGGLAARWMVRFARTGTLKRSAGAELFTVHAHVVILAAGTLGSTEILLRSPRVRCSDRLGEQVSTNGDALAFGYAQRGVVDAVAEPLAAPPGGQSDPGAGAAPGPGIGTSGWRTTGPTILGMVRVRAASGAWPATGLLEDGVVPAALRPLIGSLWATAALPHGYVRGDPAFLADRPQLDRSGLHPQLLRHTQTLLGIGPGATPGRLARAAPGAPLGLDRPLLHVGTASQVSQAGAPVASPEDPSPAGCVDDPLHAWLARAERAGGFDGGWHLPDPAARPLPDAFDGIARTLARSPLTVHPLGGCIMGATVHAGVTDDLGEVFDAGAERPDAMHAGLHVLDGALVPMALGANPLLTISAIAMRAARRIAGRLRSDAVAAAVAMGRRVEAALAALADPADPAAIVDSADSAHLAAARPGPRHPPQPAGPMRLAFTEVLFAHGPLDLSDRLRSLIEPALLRRLDRGRAGLVVELSVRCAPWQWLQAPETPWTGTARLGVYDLREPTGARAPVTGALDALRQTIGQGDAIVRMLHPDAPAGALDAAARAAAALAEMVARRGLQRPAQVPSAADATLLLRAAARHATGRLLSYELRLTGAAGPIGLRGAKRLAYRDGEKNPWQALRELDAVIEPGEAAVAGGASRVRFTVDLLDLLKRRALQISGAPDTPTSIAVTAAVGAFWLRALVSTHYWTFRAPDYGRLTGREALRVRPGNAITLADGSRIEADASWFDVRRTDHPRERMQRPFTVRLCLTRYRRPGPQPSRAILLTHGGAHGGELFTTQSVPRNLAACLVDAGFDVWVLDNRLSNRLGDVPRAPGSVDDIARFDIPVAVRRVRAATGLARIDVLAHCVGAAAMAMALLAGRLTERGRPLIGHLVLHAVPPWPVPSPWNRVSSALAAFYRDAVPVAVVDTIPPQRPGALDQLADRLAGSIPWSAAQAPLHGTHRDHREAGTAVCDRLTLFFGREYLHENLTEATHRTLWRLVGPIALGMFQHMFLVTRRQQLVDRDGDGAYLDRRSVREHWRVPTLLACGERNEVFDATGSARSALMLRALLRDRSTRPARKSRTRPARPGDPPRAIAPIGLFVPSGVGHMDFFLGQRSAEPFDAAWPGSGCFETVLAFLDRPQAPGAAGFATARKTRARAGALQALVALLTGPSVHYEWLPGDRLRLTMWLELRAWQTGMVRPFGAAVTIREADAAGADGAAAHGIVPGSCRSMRSFFAASGLALGGDYWLVRFTLPKSLARRAVQASFQTADATLLPPADRWHAGRPDAPVPGPACRLGLGALDWWRKLFVADDQPVSYAILIASCRWPGTPFEHDGVDGAVRRMLGHVQLVDPATGRVEPRAPSAPPAADALWLVGDQIYADAVADLFPVGESAERAADRYRDAFGATADPRLDEHDGSVPMRRLLASVPSWMVVDDHEFMDNWSGPPAAALDPVQSARDAGAAEVFRTRLSAAVAYQWRRFEAPGGGRPALATRPWRVRGLWHAFSVGRLPAFAMDTRTEREARTLVDRDRARLVSDAQMQALAGWLARQRDSPGPVFVLSGSVFGMPDLDTVDEPATAMDADDWHGYPRTCRDLIDAVLDAGARHVVMVSGDQHFSAAARLRLVRRHAGGCNEAVVHSISISALNATLPFANGSPERMVRAGATIDCGSRQGSDYRVSVERLDVLGTHPQQFARMEVDLSPPRGWRLRVQVLDADGGDSPGFDIQG